MKKFRIYIFYTAVLMIGMASCTKDFVQYNTDPNKATAAQLTYDNLGIGSFITQMENQVMPLTYSDENIHNYYQLIYSLAGDIYSGQQGLSNAFFNGVNNSTYALVPSWYGAAFANAYQNEMSPWYRIKQNVQGASPSTYAVAQIIRVLAMHRVTDIYGPLPYLKFNPGSLTTPYDSQESIYNSFFTDLDEAVLTLTDFIQKNPGSKPLAKFDKIYGGDYIQWLKLAGSLRLRLAMRIVYANPQKAKTEAEKAIQGGVMTSNTDNALISVDGVTTVNRLFTVTYPFNDSRMGANMESFLKGYNDSRIGLLFNKSSFAGLPDDYHGIRCGSQFNGHDYNPFSTMNVDASTPVQIMVAAESYFLRAEGALRGWNMGGTAKSLYESGIATAFAQPLGKSRQGAGDATNYINDDISVPAPYADPLNSGNNIDSGSTYLSTITIKWDDTNSFEQSLERIITQKWIALYPDGQEAWTEFRRTGYPRVFPVANNYSNGAINTNIQIRRIPFPQSEYLNNKNAVNDGAKLLGGADNGGTKLWWDKK